MAKGIVFQIQGSDPVPANEHGLFINSSGDLIHSKDDGGTTLVNITQVAEGAAPTAIVNKFVNGFGSAGTKALPVSVDSSGEVIPVDLSDDSALKMMGLSLTAFLGADPEVSVVTSGKLEDSGITADFGDILYIKPDGTLIGSSEFSSGDSPAIGVDGYLSGHHVVRVGVVTQNLANPSLKDIIVNVQYLVQL